MNRSLLGGSHSSSEQVYQSTTLPKKITKPSRKIPLVSKARRNLQPLLQNMMAVPSENTLREELKILSKMRKASGEEIALMGVFPLANMDDIEMRNIHLHYQTGQPMMSEGWCNEVHVPTDRGDLLVAVQGQRGKQPIITYHDLGLNYLSFQPFFNYVDMRQLLDNFCVYHVTAPGQEEGSGPYPDNYDYPSMDELSKQLNFVLCYFGITSFIGFGVGAGANILARFAIDQPNKVDALTLINCTASPCGWVEWAYQKMNARALRSRGMTQTVLNYLLWHHFGRQVNERKADVVEVYRRFFSRNISPINLAMLIDSYLRRSDLGISRDAETIKVPVLNITGAQSPHVDDTVSFNGRLNPNNSSWIKISDCAMVVEEQPAKLAEAFRLFVQGEGFSVVALAKLKALSISSEEPPTKI